MHLWSENGVRVEEVSQIKAVAEDYYTKLMGSNQHIFDESNGLWVGQLLDKKNSLLLV
jgi:hypothetical protein